jgi:hypothetical protein
MADIVLTQGQSLPPGTQVRYRDMGDGTHALVYSIAGAIVATIPVPGIDSVLNVNVQDVVGNKLDTVGGNSLVALNRQIMADLIVPGADSAININWGDVIGNKLDAASDGVAASLVALVRELLDALAKHDEHFHNVERWWGAVAGPNETNAIEANVDTPFAATSGNNTWGAAIPILGTADNPVLAGMLEFDCREILITDFDDDTSLWRLRIIWGDGTSADAIAAGQWTEEPVQTSAVPGNRAGGSSAEIRMPHLDIGTKLWAQVWNETNGEVLSFFWGAHGYPAPVQ